MASSLCRQKGGGLLLTGGLEAPPGLEMAFHPPEDNTVNEETDADDQQHHGEHRTHVVQVAAHHQYLAQAEAQIEHFRSDQRAPGKSPPLLQSRHDEGQTGREQDIPEQLESRRSEIASGLTKDSGCLFASIL